MKEFRQWQVYGSELEPFGEERADLRSAIVACTVANMLRGKSGRRMKPQDFMPKFSGDVKQQGADEMAKRFAAFAKAHNARLRQQKQGKG